MQAVVRKICNTAFVENSHQRRFPAANSAGARRSGRARVTERQEVEQQYGTGCHAMEHAVFCHHLGESSFDLSGHRWRGVGPGFSAWWRPEIGP
ncbi:MAG TPA: hypothetical protein VFH22_01890, partial [Rhodocyclaceae bacterium]|nr:hypothetical protein [Rhodocyclaceae bacterium]